MGDVKARIEAYKQRREKRYAEMEIKEAERPGEVHAV